MALGCKRVHDDRIAGVTFVGNASCNALIVNEEYAWVGNPFSAPRGQGEPKGSPCPLVFCRRAGFVTRDLKTPLSGVGGIDKQSQNHSCAARVRVPFSAPKQQGGPQWFSLLLWVLSCGFVPGGLKMPLSGAGEGSDSESESGGGRPVRTLPSDEKPYNATASRSVIREAGRSILYPEPFITSRTGRPDQYPGVCTMSGLGFDSNSLVGIGMA